MEATLAKNPHNYEEIKDETCVHEQKPIKRGLKNERKKEGRLLEIKIFFRKKI